MPQTHTLEDKLQRELVGKLCHKLPLTSASEGINLVSSCYHCLTAQIAEPKDER